MMNGNLSLGIDTSNYKTSVAILTEKGEILFNSQEFLKIKKGERGLRQSEALFQHVRQLPHIIKKALADKEIREKIGCVSVSVRPRPIEGSYMPVFTAGESFAETLGAALNVPVYRFSHQEGHIEAVKYYSEFKHVRRMICFHFSGGTTEALLVDEPKGKFEIVGGSKDLAYGQVLDRVGVSMGIDFPCGEALDNMAAQSKVHTNLLSPIKVRDGYVNLSGIETQAQRMLSRCNQSDMVCDLFFKLSESVKEMTLQLASKYDIDKFLYAGGVSCSRYMRTFLAENLSKDLRTAFGEAKLSSDNAIGIALLGGKNIWL